MTDSITNIAMCSVLALLLTLTGSNAEASSYVVDNQRGDDRNSGTRDAPWKTVSHAIQTIGANGSLAIRDNGPLYPYRENLIIRTGVSTNSTLRLSGTTGANQQFAKPFLLGSRDWSDVSAGGTKQWMVNQDPPETIHIKLADPPGSVWMSRTAQWQSKGVMSLQQRERASEAPLQPGQWRYAESEKSLVYRLAESETLSTLHIEVSFRRPIIFIEGSSQVSLTNIALGYSGKTAIKVANSSQVFLKELTIHHVGQNGIAVSEGDNVHISHCQIRYAANNGIVFNGSAKRPLRDSSVRHCIISDVARNDCITLHKDGRNADIGGAILLESNHLSRCAEQGLDITSGDGIHLNKNTTMDNGVSGIVLGHGVSRVAIEQHRSLNDGGTANVIIGLSSHVTMTNSCLSGNQRHQLVINRATDVSVSGSTLVKQANATGSVINIAAPASNVRFDRNLIASASRRSGYMLRYLQGSDPQRANTHFDNNTWGVLPTLQKPVYTDLLQGHSFAAHDLFYEQETSDVYLPLKEHHSLDRACQEPLPEELTAPTLKARSTQ